MFGTRRGETLSAQKNDGRGGLYLFRLSSFVPERLRFIFLLMAYLSSDKAEAELAQSIKKATSPDETAPKQKHIRRR